MCIVDVMIGADFGFNECGELVVRGLNVMCGYLGNVFVTDVIIDVDGWLYIGDVVLIDEEGYVFIVDCLKELIKVNAY